MSVFKAYDIRGLAHSELDSDFAERLGHARYGSPSQNGPVR